MENRGRLKPTDYIIPETTALTNGTIRHLCLCIYLYPAEALVLATRFSAEEGLQRTPAALATRVLA